MSNRRPTQPQQKPRPAARRVPGGLALAAAVFMLAACDSGSAPPRPQGGPEIRHCQAAVERLARDFTDVQIVRMRDWDVENVLNVAVTYDYTIPAKAQGEVDERLQGLAVCRYDYGVVRRNDANRQVKALAIRFRGRPLTPNELILLDTVISSQKPRLGF